MVNDSNSISLKSVFKISHGWVGADFVRLFNWSHVSGLMRFCDRSDSECESNFVKISEKKLDGNPGNNYTSTSCTWAFEWKSPNSP
jgi:hypothetical protein